MQLDHDRIRTIAPKQLFSRSQRDTNGPFIEFFRKTLEYTDHLEFEGIERAFRSIEQKRDTAARLEVERLGDACADRISPRRRHPPAHGPDADLHEGTQLVFLARLDALADHRPVGLAVVEQAGELKTPHHRLRFGHVGDEIGKRLVARRS
jgi:hypothetical protein